MRFHLSTVLFVFAAFPLGSLSEPLSPRWDHMHTKHSWDTVPKNWESLGCPPNSTKIDLYIALKPYREDALVDTLYEVSNPKHPRYGAYLSKEQATDLIAPHPGTLELVYSWLAHHGVPSSSVSMTHGGTTLTLNGVSVVQANALLGTSYQLFRHVETNETTVRTVSYAVPADLHELVETVAPTTFFPSPRQPPRKRSSQAASELANSTLREHATRISDPNEDNSMPSILRRLYATFAYTPTMIDNVLGIIGIRDENPSEEDLISFMHMFRSDGVDASYTPEEINGGEYDPDHPSANINSDVQYATAMAYPTTLVFYSTGRGPEGTTDYLISWFRFILNQPTQNVPQTISMSYNIVENIVPPQYAMFVCRLFGVLGVRGVSVLFSSGDDGVGRGGCVTEDGDDQFSPSFPASCPWVTAVGGTTGYAPEIAASLSGGGFSNIFPRPDYQSLSVPPFLQRLGNTYQGKYNSSSRGIPDIAAQAIGFPTVFDGDMETLDGTGCSASTVAGIISLLNDYQISRGRAPLGFLNPFLYGNGIDGIFDIIGGSNPGCGTRGFLAIGGWDAVSGLGSLDFEVLQDILDEEGVIPHPGN